MAKLGDVFKKDNIARAETHPRRITKWIHYTKLKSNKYQYCDAADKEELEALADLIEADGEVLQDVLVRKINADEYEIIGGHKRTRACRILVEERGLTAFEFIPCIVKDISDVRAEFQVYSSNGHHEETPYETMHKLERMKYLLTNYPEEFPDMQTGRMVERLARMYNMKKSTVGEYQAIANNLGEAAMEEFKQGGIEKSAAVTLSKLPEKEQENILSQGLKKDVEIKQYVEQMLEPDKEEIMLVYDRLELQDIDLPERRTVTVCLRERYGKSYTGIHDNAVSIDCSPSYITVNEKQITWSRFGKLLDSYIPYKTKSGKSEEQHEGAEECSECRHDWKERQNLLKNSQKGQDAETERRIVPNFGTQITVDEAEDGAERSPKTCIRLIQAEYDEIRNGKSYLILKRQVNIGDTLILQLFEDGRAVNESMEVKVMHIDTEETSGALAEGYCIAGIVMESS